VLRVVARRLLSSTGLRLPSGLAGDPPCGASRRGRSAACPTLRRIGPISARDGYYCSWTRTAKPSGKRQRVRDATAPTIAAGGGPAGSCLSGHCSLHLGACSDGGTTIPKSYYNAARRRRAAQTPNPMPGRRRAAGAGGAIMEAAFDAAGSRLDDRSLSGGVVACPARGARAYRDLSPRNRSRISTGLRHSSGAGAIRSSWPGCTGT